MPRYFFVIKLAAGQQHDDPFGTSFPGDADAREYAHRVIRELKAEGGCDEPGLTIIVKNELGKPVYTIPFAEALN